MSDPPVTWNVNENKDAGNRETDQGNDFAGDCVAPGSPEQEVEEEMPDEPLTCGWPGGRGSLCSSCCLHIPGREGWTSEQCREAAQHCLHLHLGREYDVKGGRLGGVRTRMFLDVLGTPEQAPWRRGLAPVGGQSGPVCVYIALHSNPNGRDGNFLTFFCLAH